MKYTLQEFTLKKRETLLDYKHFTSSSDEMSDALEIVKETLSAPDSVLADLSPADLMHPTHVRADLMTDFVGTCYSAGHPISYLRSLYPSLVEYWEAYAVYSERHNKSAEPARLTAHLALSDTDFHIANRLVCWAILLGFESMLSRVAPILDYNNGKRDGLLERLLSPFVAGRGAAPAECIRHLPYSGLLEVFAANSEERSSLVAEYLGKWYDASRREPYHESHRRGTSFNGYWCWESAAVTVVLEIDDSAYRNAQFYPSEMVAFARQVRR